MPNDHTPAETPTSAISGPFKTAAEVERLVNAFQTRTLPRPRWNHAAHLAVGLWHTLRYDDENTLRLVRERIQAYNNACGIETTLTTGYHETITRFYLHITRRFLKDVDTSRPIHELANALIARFGDKNLPLAYYSRRLLFSPTARFGWIEPDLQLLPSHDAVIDKNALLTGS